MTLLLALLLWQTASDPSVPEVLRYKREVAVHGSGQACAVLDSRIFPHAAPSLRDLRLYSEGREIPYAITLSQAAESEQEPARVVNLKPADGGVGFDLEMPPRPYTEVILNLGGRDFTVSAKVAGMDDLDAPARTELGNFTLFDLSSEHLARNTTISLQESRFKYLHVLLTGAAPAVMGAEVPPSREAQTIYTTVARATSVLRRGKDEVATFRVPARVPVERVQVTTAAGFHDSFSRVVRVTAQADAPGSVTESIEGTIAHVVRGERRLEQMSFPAALGANLQGEAAVKVTIENGDLPSLPLGSVTLEMREREICFDASASQPSLLYGNPDLAAPAYDYAAQFVPSSNPVDARLGEEQRNPAFRGQPAETFAERNPELLWVGFLAALALAGTAVLRSGHRLRHSLRHQRRS